MKALLQKRWFRLLLCAVLLVASVLVNTRLKLGRQAEKLSAQLYAEKSSAAAQTLKTLRSGLEALSSVTDKDEIASAVQELDSAIALLGNGAGISTLLDAWCEALDYPIALAKLSDVDASAAEAAVSNLHAAISSRVDAGTLQQRYAAAQQAGDALLGALGSASLSDTQRERLSQCGELLQQLRRDIAGNAYNEAVYSFLRRNSGGWTRLCASLAGVEYPKLFG